MMRLSILDFAHAASYICEIADKVRQSGGHLPGLGGWMASYIDSNTRGQRVCSCISRAWSGATRRSIRLVSYLQKRRELMDYPTYRAAGWPIGSGSVESSHKLVVQARLKGPGMHWKPEHINPMLALRLALLNERWEETWQEQHRLRQHQRHLTRQTRQQQRFREYQAQRQETHPPPLPVASMPKPPRQKTGRTQAQYRWGRQTFSSRMLKQANSAKK